MLVVKGLSGGTHHETRRTEIFDYINQLLSKKPDSRELKQLYNDLATDFLSNPRVMFLPNFFNWVNAYIINAPNLHFLAKFVLPNPVMLRNDKINDIIIFYIQNVVSFDSLKYALKNSKIIEGSKLDLSKIYNAMFTSVSESIKAESSNEMFQDLLAYVLAEPQFLEDSKIVNDLLDLILFKAFEAKWSYSYVVSNYHQFLSAPEVINNPKVVKFINMYLDKYEDLRHVSLDDPNAKFLALLTTPEIIKNEQFISWIHRYAAETSFYHDAIFNNVVFLNPLVWKHPRFKDLTADIIKYIDNSSDTKYKKDSLNKFLSNPELRKIYDFPQDARNDYFLNHLKMLITCSKAFIK